MEKQITEKETYWSRFAKDFEERNNYVVGKGDMDIIEKVLAEEKRLKNVLELACGNGTYSKILANNSTKLVATDFSQEMVAETKQRLKDIKKIEVKKANAQKLSFKKETFDTVFAANLLHIIENPQKVVQEAARVLKPKGKFMVVDLTIDGMSFVNKLGMIFRYLKTYGKPSASGTNFSLAEIIAMLEKENMKIEKSVLIGEKSKATFVVGKKM